MDHFAIMTAFGQDRPGIVALMADSLYQLGCNIEDTCMTRLRGEFTMMLMVRLPEGIAAEDLGQRLTPYTTPLDLAVLCRAMPDQAATRQTALEIPTFMLSVYGADLFDVTFAAGGKATFRSFDFQKGDFVTASGTWSVKAGAKPEVTIVSGGKATVYTPKLEAGHVILAPTGDAHPISTSSDPCSA